MKIQQGNFFHVRMLLIIPSFFVPVKFKSTLIPVFLNATSGKIILSNPCYIKHSRCFLMLLLIKYSYYFDELKNSCWSDILKEVTIQSQKTREKLEHWKTVRGLSLSYFFLNNL